MILEVTRAGHVDARARGEGHIYRLGHDDTWSCTCPHRGPNCSHLIALRSVIAIQP